MLTSSQIYDPRRDVYPGSRISDPDFGPTRIRILSKGTFGHPEVHRPQKGPLACFKLISLPRFLLAHEKDI